MNLDKGAVVEVIQKNLEGWWKIRCRSYLFLFYGTAAGAVQSRDLSVWDVQSKRS